MSSEDLRSKVQAARTDLQEAAVDVQTRYDNLETTDLTAIEELTEHLREFDRLLEQYEDRATGTGDFGGYVAFRNEVDSFVEDLPEDLPHRGTFEEAGEILDQRRLADRHFEQARETLQPARSLVDDHREYRAARESFVETRRTARKRVQEAADRIAELDRMLEWASLDLDAPIADLREPIDSYNDEIESAFENYLRATPAAEVLDLFARTDRYPLVSMPAPPPDLHEYITEFEDPLTIHELLEYASYSRSKLAHYVDDPGAFKAAIATEQTYLERINAEPFTIDWPPPPAADLRWRLPELRRVIDHFAPESTIATLRQLRSLTRDRDRFERLRSVAEAHNSMSQAELTRLRSGAIAEDREELAAIRDRLESTIDDVTIPAE